MTKDVILKPSRRKEKTHFMPVSRQVPVHGPGAPGPAELRWPGPLHSPRVFPVHSHNALHPFAQLLHLYNLLLLHLLQELRELRERGPVVGDSITHTEHLGCARHRARQVLGKGVGHSLPSPKKLGGPHPEGQGVRSS